MSLALLVLSHSVPPLGAANAEDFDCLMNPDEVIEVGSPVVGLLDEVLVDRGDTVRKGQIIARLESSAEQSTIALLETQANSVAVIEAQTKQVATADKRYQRVESLRDRGIATEEALDKAFAELVAAQSILIQVKLKHEVAVKELERAKVALEQRSIQSPADGVITERSLVAGERVSSEDHIVQIVRLDPLKIETFLPVSIYGKIAIGDEVTVVPVSPLSGEYTATVTVVDRVFDAASGTFAVVLELPNPNGVLPAGNRCIMRLISPGAK
ncbi:efflux RND transporter periplasmic adaptor subunit [Roseibium salinum]|uniref:Efflux RND transporter periplasmic adaptor subunit n=1 Tax=Roseibium salinum TaxID=1604349 RepID=A0ABT3QVG5_9HYPH|nr:efflux RND transporter periplasmic adaptor subunit [Roseibium sp. DSM 29163]